MARLLAKDQNTRRRLQVRGIKAVSIVCQLAIELGACLASRGIKIVFGGSGLGLLGVMGNAAIAAGGKTLGIVPELFLSEYS